MAWCGGLRADHGQKHDPGGEMLTPGLDTQPPITEADDRLKPVFGKDKVTMFEMNKYLAQHLK
jgi:chromatin remodeling complex protein RSC6